MARLVGHWTKLPRETEDCPFLETSEVRLDEALTRGWGHQSFFLLLLLPQGEDSSCSSPTPAWCCSRGKHFFTKCSSMIPFHRVYSFRNSLSPSWGHNSCQQTFSSMGSSVQDSADPYQEPAQLGVPAGSQHPLGTSTSSFRGCRGIYALAPGARPSSPLSLTSVCVELFM